MKTLKSVEEDRKKYYKKKNINTVHRSSLLVPRLLNNQTYISFVNHYLIKRGYSDIVMKVFPFDINGKSGDAITFKIDQAKVYTFNLDKLFEGEFFYNCYQIEFFTSENLFIPYPAVMVNHINENSINTVHAYNRILNDAREMEKIDEIEVLEASIDLILNNKKDTFIILQTGMIALQNENLEMHFLSNNNKNPSFKKNINISIPKMSIKKINLSSFFKDADKLNIIPGDYTVKVKQPKQPIFYGRLLVGVENKESNSFSANHSYYDNSNNKEYFNNKKSYKTMPYFSKFINKLHIYPIMSPGHGYFSLYINIKNGEIIKPYLLEKQKFINDKSTLLFDTEALINQSNITGDIKTFTLVYESSNEYKAPSRVNYQLVYGPKIENGVNSSINVSLFNDEVFVPSTKDSKVWCQMLNKKGYEALLGICFIDDFDKDPKQKHEVHLDIYDEKGLIKQLDINLNILDNYVVSNKDFKSESPFIWIFAKCKKPNLLMETFSFNSKSGFSSGEHSFGSW